MRILLTGGTGFLGAKVLELLKECSEVTDIHLTSRHPQNAPETPGLNDSKVHWIQTDLSDAKSLKRALGELELEPIHAVIHLAGLYDLDATITQNRAGNVKATEHLTAWLETHQPKTPLLFASTFAVGYSETDTSILEETPLIRKSQIPGRENAYAHTKALAEKRITDSNLPYEIFRLGVLVASQDEPPVKIDGPYSFLKFFSDSKFSETIKKLPLLPLPCDPTTPLPFVPVVTAAQVLVRAALEAEGTRRIYAVHEESKHCLTVKEFAHSALGRYAPTTYPLFVKVSIKFLYTFGGLGRRALAFQNRFTGISKTQFEFTNWKRPFSNSNFRTRFRSISIPKFHSYESDFYKGFEESLKTRAPIRCAFILHQLSENDLFRHPAFKLVQFAPKQVHRLIQDFAPRLPIFPYGTLRGAKSQSTGREVQCDFYVWAAAPKQLMQMEPETLYKHLDRATRLAAKRGAKIVGLGAYTKVAGDAGISISMKSPIPVTNGNSYSAATTLWAAQTMVEKLGLADPKNIKAAVIGATGGIGRVSALLISEKVSELLIVAPRIAKLRELEAEIKAHSPQIKVTLETKANEAISDCDLIILSTSNLSGQTLDLGLVKSGAVVCDCSRPLDVSKEEAARRPDVLVIESGEVKLPGETQLNCDLGLPKPNVYACLAETVLLAMEERFESYSLSKKLSVDRVREIFEIGLKHGASLSEIRGPLGVVTESDLESVRARAIAVRAASRPGLRPEQPLPDPTSVPERLVSAAQRPLQVQAQVSASMTSSLPRG